jgi:2',3'-cyclic-nucleotide 2'-phosphodiesterase (5'-nucleotidase family)
MKEKFVIMILCLSVLQLSAQDYTWKAGKIDGSRTGCSVPSKNNISEAVGYFERGTYVAPNGLKFKKNTTTAKTAEVVIGAQPAMERVKDVIAQSSQAMSVQYPEGPLSNWFVDILMRKAEALSGKKVDVGVANFGGIRVNMPEGDVTLDDMLSMFPFKNQVIYVEHKGITLRKMLEKMAAGRFEVLGGVRVVAEDGKLVSAEIDGEPIDDNKVYGVATVSFLLYGGDGLRLADDAVSLKKFDVDIIDAVLEHVHAETAAGRTIQYESDGRVIIRK